MKIRAARASVLRIPLSRQPAFATRQLTHRDYALIRVETEEGIEGIAYCLEGVLVSAAVTELLAALLVGEDPFDTRRLWDKMFRAGLQVGRRGAVLRAISCIDIALWDIKGKATGLPVHKLLGSFRGEVPAYASGGYYFAGGNGLDGLADEVRDYVDRGFDAVKIKIGRLDARAEAERLRVVRDAVGPNVKIMVDANNAWNDLPTELETIPTGPPWTTTTTAPDYDRGQ